jgi:HEAT repeat protein
MVEDGRVEETPPGLVYGPIVYVDREKTERDLTSGDEQLVARAVLAASLKDIDAAWVFDRCLTMVDDPRVGVRRAVALAIGHLAIPRDFVDERRAREALGRLAADPLVRPAASDALSDVEHALAIRPDAGR